MKLYKVIVDKGDIEVGSIVRRKTSELDDSHSKCYETLDGKDLVFLMDKDVVPYEVIEVVVDVEEPTKEADSIPIEKPLALRIENDNNQTRVWLNGVEQKHINSIEFKHYVDGTPNLVLGHDIF